MATRAFFFGMRRAQPPVAWRRGRSGCGRRWRRPRRGRRRCRGCRGRWRSCPCACRRTRPGAGRDPGPGGQVAGGREDAHVDADLGDQVLGGGDPEPGDGVQLGDLPLVRLAQDGDLRVQHGDLGGEWSMLSSIISRMKACSGVKNEQSRASSSRAILGRILPRAIRASTFGAALAGDDRAEHRPAGEPVDVADHRRQLQVPVLQQLLAALLLPVGSGSVAPVAGMGAQPADLLRAARSWRQHAPLGDPGQPHRVSRSVFGRPGSALTCAA